MKFSENFIEDIFLFIRLSIKKNNFNNILYALKIKFNKSIFNVIISNDLQ